MTDETPVTPGWVEQRTDEIFATLPEETRPACDAYLICLSRQKAPSAPSDLLGAELQSCRTALKRALATAGIDDATLARVDADLEALEAEYTAES